MILSKNGWWCQVIRISNFEREFIYFVYISQTHKFSWHKLNSCFCLTLSRRSVQGYAFDFLFHKHQKPCNTSLICQLKNNHNVQLFVSHSNKSFLCSIRPNSINNNLIYNLSPLPYHLETEVKNKLQKKWLLLLILHIQLLPFL